MEKVKKRLSIFKMGLILAIFIYETNSGPTRLELKQLSSAPKMVLGLSKDEQS